MSVASRLQFFASLNGNGGSQNNLASSPNTPKPAGNGSSAPANSRTDLQPRAASNHHMVTRSMDNLTKVRGEQTSEDQGSQHHLTIKERIARYGSNSGGGKNDGGSRSSLSDMRARLASAKSLSSVASPSRHHHHDHYEDKDSGRRASVGSGHRKSIGASHRPAPYPTAAVAQSRHPSDHDLAHSSHHSSQSSLHTHQHQTQQQDKDAVAQEPAQEPQQEVQQSPLDNNDNDNGVLPMELSHPPITNNNNTSEDMTIHQIPVPAPMVVKFASAAVPAPATAKSTTTPSTPSKFGAPPPKCASCAKSVYIVEQVTIDNQTFHKTCLKCSHCKATLKMGNLASMNGAYYCKPHFKQLFKLKGNYSEGFGLEDHKKQWLEGADGREPAAAKQ
ncbi:hypothetical protein PhCBS80983_g03164 [Powellomyces hirtus]|uniref:LIM zinc-binding domain-containing protein n=1 Tax=Powellomyces hirtus TaxID=109895 RepID=A0A507E2S7_9FUNG|nr:hypothetical protein PhCBS80983_g03164 [Powellomyces hirtus]